MEGLASSPTGLALRMLAQKTSAKPSATVPPDAKSESDPKNAINRAITDLTDVMDEIPQLKAIVEDLQNILKSPDTDESSQDNEDED